MPDIENRNRYELTSELPVHISEETTPVIKILVLLNGNEFNGRLLGSDGFERAEFPIFPKYPLDWTNVNGINHL